MLMGVQPIALPAVSLRIVNATSCVCFSSSPSSHGLLPFVFHLPPIHGASAHYLMFHLVHMLVVLPSSCRVKYRPFHVAMFV